MAQGRLQADRRLAIASAALMWSAASEDQLQEFIRSGLLDVTEPEEEVIPYDPDLLKRMVAEGKL
jgi:hypothetical protein